MKELYSVLIVDDESILRNGLKHICDWEEEGFQLIGEAANGKEALEIIKDKEPNIVITDLIMPEIDGVELTKIIKKDYPNTKVLVLSNVSEFEYVKDTFKYGIHDYLLKTEASAESIVPILKNMIDEIHYIDNKNKRIDKTEKLENDLTSLILYRRIDDNDLASLKEYFYMNNFYVMMTEMYQLDEEYVDLKEMHYEIKNKFNNVMNENPYIVLLIKNKLIVVINYDKYKNIKLKKDINLIAEDIMKEFNVKTFVISDSIEKISEIYLAYDECIRISKKAIYFNKALIGIKDIKESNVTTKFDYDSLNSYIGKLNFTEVINLVKEYFYSLKENVCIDEYDLKKFSQNLIYNALNTIESLDSELINISRKKIILFKQIDIARSFDEIIKIVVETFKYIEELSKNKLDSRNDNFIIKIVKDYVDKNYRDEISVASISKDLNINYNYLSYCFKNETNENLSSYISRIRIEKAKLYLEDLKIPISNISEMVGFSEHNYFSKIFKKYTSLTPSEYRRMAKLNDKKR